MLCKTFDVPPMNGGCGHYCKLLNPRIVFGVACGPLCKNGTVVELKIEIPKKYTFEMDDSDPTVADFKSYVLSMRRTYGIRDNAYEVSHIDTPKINRGSYTNSFAKYSYGQIIVASFLQRKDIDILIGLDTLLPVKPNKQTAQALSNLYSVLCRAALLIDDRGSVVQYHNYFTSTSPLFTITAVSYLAEYSFKHMRPLTATYLKEGFPNVY